MTRATIGIDVQELALSEQPASLMRRATYVLRLHRWLLLFVAVYFLSAVLTSDVTGRALILPWSFLQRLLIILGVLIPWGIAGYSAYVVWKNRPEHPIGFLTAELPRTILSPERCFGALLALTALYFHAAAFSFFKCAIPDFQPFTWDGWLASCDSILHFGTQPSELLQPLLGYNWATRCIDFLYVFWVILILSGVLWFAIGPCDSRLRMQLLLTNVLVWFLLGNVVATALSSAGPCYFHNVCDAPDPFATHMQYLNQLHEQSKTYALRIQDGLWEGYANHNNTLGFGISAMPSLHVGTTLMLALAVWRLSRVGGSLLFVYTVLMMIGSVHLGWHYAVDGYVAMAGICLIWWGVGRLLARDPLFDAE